MTHGLLAVGMVVWFGVAGVGLGYLLEPWLLRLVRGGIRALRVADGRRHPEPAEDEVGLWTRRWSRIAGFVLFFAGAVVINLLPLAPASQRIVLGGFAVGLPGLGYLVRWHRRPRRG